MGNNCHSGKRKKLKYERFFFFFGFYNCHTNTRIGGKLSKKNCFYFLNRKINCNNIFVIS